MKSLFILGVVAGASTLVSATETATHNPETAVVRADEVGSVQGRVSFEGDRPDPLAKLSIGAKESEGCCPNPPDCVDSTDRTLLIDEKGGIANVVVMLTVKGQEPRVPTEPVHLDQKGCRFEPRVLVVPAGATIAYQNSDGVNHNIHTYAKKNSAINKNVAGGTSESQVLEKDEDFEVKCDIHPWMLSHVVVTEATHYTVTGPDGSFALNDVPPGTYTLEYWHEKLGKGKSAEVTVAAGGAAKGDFELGESKKKKRR